MISNATGEKFCLNCHIRHTVGAVQILALITLVSSSLYLLPLAYSQELSYTYGRGQFGIADAEFSSPEGIAVDQAGNVYVADTINNRIQVFSNDGTFLSVFGEYGRANGTLRSPEGIAVDQAGNVYVADTGNNRIQVFSSNGTVESVFGEYGLSEQGLRYPSGIVVDLSSSNVYVADTGNNRISALATSAPTSDMTFSGEEGQTNGNDTADQMIIPGLF